MTGQYPRRRETDREATRRVFALKWRRAKRAALLRRVGRGSMPVAMRPRISASGRLVAR